jgi:hypothetical protein
VYRFVAQLGSRTRIVEIQGEHTLADLDRALRSAFRHDPYDHLGGFWRLFTRGNSQRRRREVRLGDVDPSGGGDGASIPIATLGLQVNAMLKYVYDFGDWVEHSLMVEAISEPQPHVKYPRVIKAG